MKVVVPLIGTESRVIEPGMGSEVREEKDTPLPGDSTDADVAHRFDKTSFRQDLGGGNAPARGAHAATAPLASGRGAVAALFRSNPRTKALSPDPLRPPIDLAPPLPAFTDDA
jgi:hypothetical protein